MSNNGFEVEKAESSSNMNYLSANNTNITEISRDTTTTMDNTAEQSNEASTSAKGWYTSERENSDVEMKELNSEEKDDTEGDGIPKDENVEGEKLKDGEKKEEQIETGKKQEGEEKQEDDKKEDIGDTEDREKVVESEKADEIEKVEGYKNDEERKVEEDKVDESKVDEAEKVVNGEKVERLKDEKAEEKDTSVKKRETDKDESVEPMKKRQCLEENEKTEGLLRKILILYFSLF